jgi:hypothetical protein
METLIYLPMFVAGFGCGFYMRDWVFKRQRAKPAMTTYKVEMAAASTWLPLDRPPEKKHEKLATVDFQKVQMSDELRSLLELLPPDEKRKT